MVSYIYHYICSLRRHIFKHHSVIHVYFSLLHWSSILIDQEVIKRLRSFLDFSEKLNIPVWPENTFLPLGLHAECLVPSVKIALDLHYKCKGYYSYQGNILKFMPFIIAHTVCYCCSRWNSSFRAKPWFDSTSGIWTLSVPVTSTKHLPSAPKSLLQVLSQIHSYLCYVRFQKFLIDAWKAWNVSEHAVSVFMLLSRINAAEMCHAVDEGLFTQGPELITANV